MYCAIWGDVLSHCRFFDLMVYKVKNGRKRLVGEVRCPC
jgi:hypothetical protein